MRRRRWIGRWQGRVGFTIVELVVVMAAITVIVALVMPAFASVRAQSRSTMCLSNLRQLFGALELARQQQEDVLPYCAPLPVEPGVIEFVPSLPTRLELILPRESEVWRCPADHSHESELIGCSYLYVAGAFMLAEPPSLTALPLHAERERVAKLITQRWTNSYLRTLPLLADSDAYHNYGNREPWNAVFPDGHARPTKREDGQIDDPDHHPSAPGPDPGHEG